MFVTPYATYDGFADFTDGAPLADLPLRDLEANSRAVMNATRAWCFTAVNLQHRVDCAC